MSYTTPATFVAGNVLTAAQLNTNIRDNIAWAATDSPAARAYRNSLQSVTTGVSADITFDQERFDNAAVHSTAVNTNRFTVPTGGAGKYVLGATVFAAANASASVWQTYLLINGVTACGRVTPKFDATLVSGATLMTVYSMAVADYMTLTIDQASGGAVNYGGDPGTGPEAFVFWYRT